MNLRKTISHGLTKSSIKIIKKKKKEVSPKVGSYLEI